MRSLFKCLNPCEESGQAGRGRSTVARMVAQTGALLLAKLIPDAASLPSSPRSHSSPSPPPPLRSRSPPSLPRIPFSKVEDFANSRIMRGRIGRRRRYHSHHSHFHNAILAGGQRHRPRSHMQAGYTAMEVVSTRPHIPQGIERGRSPVCRMPT